jgi:CheY-like chemotaxis protein
MVGLGGEKLETILVVDDSDLVLEVVVAILESACFFVLQARSGPNAIKVAGDYAGRIDLLLADVKMPELSGPTLGETIKQTRPDIHVMLMSGFGEGDLLVLNYGWALIEKPFASKKLVEMVKSVLRTRDRIQSGHDFDTRNDRGQSGEKSREEKIKGVTSTPIPPERAPTTVSEYLETEACTAEGGGHNGNLTAHAHELREWATIASWQEEELTRLRTAQSGGPFTPPLAAGPRPASTSETSAISRRVPLEFPGDQSRREKRRTAIAASGNTWATGGDAA